MTLLETRFTVDFSWKPIYVAVGIHAREGNAYEIDLIIACRQYLRISTCLLLLCKN